MTINLKQLIADREAGTGGPWHVWGRDPTPENRKRGYWDVEGNSNVANDITYDDARRIARLPDLEAAFLEAVELLEQYGHGYADHSADARRFLEKLK